MISKNTEYLSRLDHLRFVAAALVVAYHFGSGNIPADTLNPLLRVLKEGYAGVSLFMVLSGFILTRICLGKVVDYKAFIFNRFLRIYPLYILFVFAAAYAGGRKMEFVSFLALASFMGNLGFVNLPKFPHIWTIMIEFQFYLIFPFIVRFFSRDGFPYIIGVIGVALLLRAMMYLADGSVQDAAYWTILGRFDQFAIGMIVAAIYERWPKMLASPIWLLVCCGAVVGWFFVFTKWCGGYYGPGSPASTSVAWVVGPTLEAMAFGAAVLAYLHLRWRIPDVLDRTLAYLGAISFSIYMWHFPIIQLFQKYFPALPFGALWYLNLVVFVFPVVIAVSSLSYFMIEKPFFSLRTVYVRKPVPPSADPALVQSVR